MNSNLSKLSRSQRQVLQENSQLKAALAKCEAANRQLAAENLRLTEQTPQCPQETLKYAAFIDSRMKATPKLCSLLTDRIPSFPAFIEQLAARPEECLLKALQVISDVLVHELSEAVRSPQRSLAEPENVQSIISSQSERLSHLHKQISETMTSSQELLCSPLARSNRLPSASRPSSRQQSSN